MFHDELSDRDFVRMIIQYYERFIELTVCRWTVYATRELVREGHVTLNMTFHFSCSDKAGTTILVLIFMFFVVSQTKLAQANTLNVTRDLVVLYVKIKYKVMCEGYTFGLCKFELEDPTHLTN